MELININNRVLLQSVKRLVNFLLFMYLTCVYRTRNITTFQDSSETTVLYRPFNKVFQINP